MIKIKPITTYYAVTRVPNFKKHKKILLKYFEEMEGASFNKDRQEISKTDWNVPPNVPRNYMQYFIDMIVPVYSKAVEELSYGSFMIDNVWFQQYVKGDMHDWHTHPEHTFSNILFVELPKGTETQFLDPFRKKVLIPEVKEGDILIALGALWHRSPPNQTNKRKTSLIFNSKFKGNKPFEHRNDYP